MEGETGNLGKHLEWRDRGEELVGRISECRRYVIDVTGLDLFSLGDLGGSSALASSVLLDELRQWKLVGVSGTCTN